MSLLYSLAPLIAFIISCGDPVTEQNPESVRDSIAEYRQQITNLNREIRRMENTLSAMGERVTAREATRVRVNELKPGNVDHYFRINGSVEAVLDATISPELSGLIENINVSRGDRVNAGQILARLNTSVIENNIEEVRTNLQMAETIYERQRRLWEQDIGSEIQYLEARNRYQGLESSLISMESQLGLANLRAPFQGIVDDISTWEGEMAMPGSPVMQIINLDNLYVNTDVSERYLPDINSGDSVILRFPVFPDYEAHVPIYRLGNIINPENRSFRLQLRISNPGERFKPNMVATLGIRSFTAIDVISIPSILIKQDVQGYFVYVARRNQDGNYNAEQVYLERGPESEGRTVIDSGLEDGELLITDGHNQVGDGDPIQFMDK